MKKKYLEIEKVSESMLKKLPESERNLHIEKENLTIPEDVIRVGVKENEELKNDNARLVKENEELKNDNARLVKENEEYRDNIAKANKQLLDMSQSITFRIVHCVNRLFRQGFSKEKNERRLFRRWIVTRIKGFPDFDHRYNPLYSVVYFLAEKKHYPTNEKVEFPKEICGKLADHLKYQDEFFKSFEIDEPKEESEAKGINQILDALKERTYKGIIVYPHVVFWEPLQTPQQLLRAFANNGWLCFFCEFSHLGDEVCREVEHNLFVTKEKYLVESISDRTIIVLLTWMGSWSFVKNFPNAEIWYHVLDNLEIFSYYDEYYRRLHDYTVSVAGLVSYVSQPLNKQYSLGENPLYLPNGVNPNEIKSLIRTGFIPHDMDNILKKGHKIVGYYGYLAEWMDYKLISWLSISRPEYEFVFIGKSICDTSQIEGLDNVYLLGLKDYKELFDYAKYFDVAIIPFIVDEKMDCVRPIKFYEYLSLGKPVVSSFIPEIDQYASNYPFIYTAKTQNDFLRSIDLAMDKSAKMTAERIGPLLGERNSWHSRILLLEKYLTPTQENILCQNYTSPDIIELGVIDYNFRFQRPQHLAKRLAKKGHRVFYINANFTAVMETILIAKNLYQISLPFLSDSAIHVTDLNDKIDLLSKCFDDIIKSQKIRDAVVVVDYPNWILAAEYLRRHYGFRILADYMDDYTGFASQQNQLIRDNCFRLLQKADAVVASSAFLEDIAKKNNNNVSIIRNGTEYHYFHKAYNYNHKKSKRPIIGYFGAIAEWFNVDVVCRCAEYFPECEIILVGAITAHNKRLESYENILLVGEVPYSDLLSWINTFDVCLIPFDTSSNLIKATNPVKFYEYLSAGKKIVATEIPELQPYAGRLVLLENEPERFCKAVLSCLNGTDTLSSPEDMFLFARSNDWDMRASDIECVIDTVYPKVSIVVLCYNQLDYTKQCIKSIFEKTAYPNYELILVDNNSNDGTEEYLRDLKRSYTNIKVVINEFNRGFAGGNNDGIAVSDGDYIVLLNNDTIVSRGWITGLLKHFDCVDKVALVGSVTNSIGNEAQIEVDYTKIEDMDDFAFRYTQTHMGEEYPHDGMLAMYCIMISRDFYNVAGPLDENYGIGMFEDDDYSMAAIKNGYKIVMAEDVFVHHYGSVSFKALGNEHYKQLFNNNKSYFERKWNTEWKMGKYR